VIVSPHDLHVGASLQLLDVAGSMDVC